MNVQETRLLCPQITLNAHGLCPFGGAETGVLLSGAFPVFVLLGA